MEFVWHALKHSLIMFPFLFGTYILIELFETWTTKKFNKNILKNPIAPLVGAGLGLLPQCGFSVVATDLYSHKKLSMGTLLAIFIATSDEAIPLLIVSPSKVAYLLPLLAIKFVFALIIGFSCDAIVKAYEKKQIKKLEAKKSYESNEIENNSNKIDNLNEQNINNKSQEQKTSKPCLQENISITKTIPKNPENEDNNNLKNNQIENEDKCHIGCCGHHIEEENEHWAKHYLLHPLIHSLKIFAFVLIINIIFSGIMHFIGQDALSNFLASSKMFSPLISVLIGLIPNCASSIVITQLFVNGGITFGACLAGLTANAGLGLVILLKENKNIKNNILIITILTISSLVLGYATQLIMMLF